MKRKSICHANTLLSIGISAWAAAFYGLVFYVAGSAAYALISDAVEFAAFALITLTLIVTESLFRILLFRIFPTGAYRDGEMIVVEYLFGLVKKRYVGTVRYTESGPEKYCSILNKKGKAVRNFSSFFYRLKPEADSES